MAGRQARVGFFYTKNMKLATQDDTTCQPEPDFTDIFVTKFTLGV